MLSSTYSSVTVGAVQDTSCDKTKTWWHIMNHMCSVTQKESVCWPMFIWPLCIVFLCRSHSWSLYRLFRYTLYSISQCTTHKYHVLIDTSVFHVTLSSFRNCQYTQLLSYGSCAVDTATATGTMHEAPQCHISKNYTHSNNNYR